MVEGDVKKTLEHHLLEVKAGRRHFENSFQAISRMILGSSDSVEKKTVNGKQTYDFKIFRKGKKHIIGMFNELNEFVSYVKDGAEGGSSKETAFVLIGEPGNGKTFFVDYLSNTYREFISQTENRKFTFKFTGLKEIGTYGKIGAIESQTFEDPMILAMNLFESSDKNLEFLSRAGFSDEQIRKFLENYRPLGACSDYILNEIKTFCDEDIEKITRHIEIVPVFISPTSGVLTGKYPATDKITSSAANLLGEESLKRTLKIENDDNPYIYDLREGALARIAGGGIHFADEIFKNKVDLINVYLGVIQNRVIELKGYKWPIDSLIIATSNNEEYNKFREGKEEAPIIDRCQRCFMSHNTDYRLQKELTSYALGETDKTTFEGEPLHQDPNLNYSFSAAITLSRMPESEKLTPVEMMKLAAGEVVEGKSFKTLAEVINELDHNSDVTKRFGQKGLGHRSLGRAIMNLLSNSETHHGKCMFAGDVFGSVEKVVLDYITDTNERTKYLKDVEIAKGLYKEEIRKSIFDAYMDEPGAIIRDVLNYVNMIIGLDAKDLGSEKQWTYKDPQSGKLQSIKIDERFIDSVEERLNLKTQEQKENARNTIRKIYGQKITSDPNYTFMDNNDLVRAVTEVRLNSDVNGAGSLIGALSNRTNEENQKLYNRMIETMKGKLHYCDTCAQKTIELFCTHEDEN